MLHFLSLLAALAVIITGVTVLGLGNWRKFKLKFAAVAFSTSAAIWLFIFTAYGQALRIQHSEDFVSLTWSFYHIVRNGVFVLFHVAVGRDAIRFKQQERRKSPDNEREDHGRGAGKAGENMAGAAWHQRTGGRKPGHPL